MIEFKNDASGRLRVIVDDFFSVTPGSALDRYLAGMTVEYRYKEPFKDKSNNWIKVEWDFNEWSNTKFEYRVR